VYLDLKHGNLVLRAHEFFGQRQPKYTWALGTRLVFLSNPDIFRLRSFEFAAEPSTVILHEVLTTKGVDVWELL